MTVIIPEQLELLKTKCEGKHNCVAQACSSFWGTKPTCDPSDKAYMWVHYRQVKDVLLMSIQRCFKVVLVDRILQRQVKSKI